MGVCGFFLLAAAFPLIAAAADEPSLRLVKDAVYFTEPYTRLDRPMKDLIAMSLDLEYEYVKYPLGFVDTLDTSEPLIEYGKRVVIRDPLQKERLFERTDLREGDRITVVSSEGAVHEASIRSFSYYGNSPSTIVVAADLRIESENPDPALFSGHGIALKGMYDIPDQTKVHAKKPLAEGDRLREKLLSICKEDLPDGWVSRDEEVTAAVMEPGGKPWYFVSYWRRPEQDFEIDQVALSACMVRHSGEGWTKSSPPLPMKLIQVYDLDGNGKAEIFALTGDGLHVCYIFLAPQDNGAYRVVRKGFCAGY